jgi:antitoxin component of RelBE/YafQ-DinJ toxin-antitoxin module
MVHDNGGQGAAMMDCTLSIALDPRLKVGAECTLALLGLSLSDAVQAFLVEVVTQRRLPFPMPGDEPGKDETPAELRAELLLELIASVTARLARMEASEAFPEKRSEHATVRQGLLAKRFQFDPQVGALTREFEGYARALASVPEQEAGETDSRG